MTNRYHDWSLVWSPEDKQDLNISNINIILKVLKKLTTRYNVEYEQGENSNPHLDIVASFKSKQARKDIADRLTVNPAIIFWPSNKGPLSINRITDWDYRLGYNTKENEDWPFIDISFPKSFNVSAEEIEIATAHYIKLNKERENVKKIKNNFKYISKKQTLYTLNNYQISNNIPTPRSESDFIDLIKAMILEGYYFDIRQNEKHEMYKFYLGFHKQTLSQKQLDEWILSEIEFQEKYEMNLNDGPIYPQNLPSPTTDLTCVKTLDFS